MQFIASNPIEATETIAEFINTKLEQGSVLLLLSGGSNIAIGVGIRDRLQLKNKLTIGLVDERFGSIGHADSNWQQLIEAGLNPNGIELLPVIRDDKEIEACADEYGTQLVNALENHDYALAIYGIGNDGHTSGVLPNSEALYSQKLITHYQGPDYPRITTTLGFIPLLKRIYVLAFGDTKSAVLRQLHDEQIDIASQPAQALKEAQELLVYNDAIND